MNVNIGDGCWVSGERNAYHGTVIGIDGDMACIELDNGMVTFENMTEEPTEMECAMVLSALGFDVVELDDEEDDDEPGVSWYERFRDHQRDVANEVTR